MTNRKLNLRRIDFNPAEREGAASTVLNTSICRLTVRSHASETILRLPSVRMSLTTAEDGSGTPSPYSARGHFFSPTQSPRSPLFSLQGSSPASPRLSIVITRRRSQHTITFDLVLCLKILVLLWLVPTTMGLAMPSGATRWQYRSTTHKQTPRDLSVSRLEAISVSLAKVSDASSLRFRLGLVKFCSGVAAQEKNWLSAAVADQACRIAFPLRYGELQRWHRLEDGSLEADLQSAMRVLKETVQAALPPTTTFRVEGRVKR